MSYGFRILVNGDYACFTRPEMKVERVSYDVPTPSAIEGMLKSIYWKPAIRYYVDKIIVFNSINFVNIRRNEVKDKVSFSKAKQCVKQVERGNRENQAADLTIYTSESRSQRAALVLKNVCYGIEYHFEMTGCKSEKEDENEKKHYNIIKRRLENGQFFRSPCLGCCEFPVKDIKLTDEFDLSAVSNTLKDKDIDLGFMLYGLDFEDKSKPINGDWERPVFSDKATAVYYRPHIINGVIDVAEYRRIAKC